MSEIDFPDSEDIASKEVIFEGDAPNNVNTDVVFQPNTLVGLFSATTPSNGPSWGLISGGSLTADAFISVFQKTSTDNNGIMRLKKLEGAAWASLTANGSLTGWSIRTILGNYYGFVEENVPSDGGQAQAFCSSLDSVPNPRLLVGPIGNTYFLYECEDSGNSFTGSTAEAVGDIFVVSQGEASGAFVTYECINTGTSTTDPAEFTGPINGIEGSYFTSYTPLTGGAQCDYPFSWSWDQNLQIWKFDCSVTAWLAEGATRINTETPEQGSQGFQGYQGRQGFQGIVGPTGVILHGSDNEVQYNLNQTLTSSPSLSIFDFYPTTPSSGLKGNFLNYSESCRIDNNTYSNGSIINLNFKSYNTYRATNIRLNEDKTLTFSGFNTAGTGETLTLILGYTGASDSKIVIPGTEEIYWSNGPIGNPDGGQQTTLKASPNKKISVFNFFNDGQRTYGNYSTDYEKGV